LSSTATAAKEYAKWIKDTVVRNTTDGERVLVVAHKDLFDHDYLEGSEDPDHPLDWSGRRVSTLHWGIGVGSNKYQDCMAVFEFGEFHVPRRVAIGNVHGWTDTRPTSEALRSASGQNPTGHYLTAYEGHLLRWAKQIGSRGTIRNLDADGRCGAMRLYTTMDQERLFKSMPYLWPGASRPTLLENGLDKPKTNGRAGLARLLGVHAGDVLWADEIEALTDIKPGHLSGALKSKQVAAAIEAFGWRLVSAKDLGRSGRGKALVKTKVP